MNEILILILIKKGYDMKKVLIILALFLCTQQLNIFAETTEQKFDKAIQTFEQGESMFRQQAEITAKQLQDPQTIQLLAAIQMEISAASSWISKSIIEVLKFMYADLKAEINSLKKPTAK